MVDLSATQDHKYTMVADICWPLPFRKKRKQTKNTEVKKSYVRRRLREPPHRSYSMRPAPCLLDFNLREKKKNTGTNKKLCAHLIDFILLVKKKTIY